MWLRPEIFTPCDGRSYKSWISRAIGKGSIPEAEAWAVLEACEDAGGTARPFPTDKVGFDVLRPGKAKADPTQGFSNGNSASRNFVTPCGFCQDFHHKGAYSDCDSVVIPPLVA